MTAFFRSIGASFGTFNEASKVSGFIIVACMMYLGYMIPKPAMHPWFVWLFWINPMAYGFDAILSNEFHDKIIPCVGINLVPSGPGFSNSSHQACAGVSGAIPGQTFVNGDDYLASLSYSHARIWRNFGIVWAWWAFFVALTIWSTSKWASSTENGPRLVVPRERARPMAAQRQIDEEGQVDEKKVTPSGSDAEVTVASEGQVQKGLVRNSSIFTWRDLFYTIKAPYGDRILLNNVQGYVKPGNLTALMGSSGAGKSTLLDVLAQRKTEGTIHGSIQLDGQPLPISFQRSVGYCEQLDVHEPYSTVREALEFSALLRQSRETQRDEKLAYVETIIDLLELHDLADTLIGQEGTGLSIEQRKRVTIGFELVSKPRILFLDEPTSGLDGQSAFHTVRFLRKLAAVGQAVLVTIHQPSAQLFAQFDQLLLLAKGGKTVYFGDIGEQADTIRDYFERYGAPCPATANPAEHMIDVVSGTLFGSRDWHAVWLSSPEYKTLNIELDLIIQEAATNPLSEGIADNYEFAMPLWEQIKFVTQRMNVSLYRNTEYVNNKIMLHIICALFNGFSFWKIGDSASELQLKLFAIFNFIFVAPGVLAQLQPLFIHRRDIFEAREKKAKMYSWTAFVTGLIVSEIPYLIFCATIYFLCWYYTVGFPATTSRAGATFFVMLMYEFLYTGMGQFIAAYAPNAVFAALTNPMLLGALVSFCGVLVPYAQIQAFWRYWIYYLNPFNYLMGSLLVFSLWGSNVQCTEGEFAVFNPPNGQTCGEYMSSYLARAPGQLANPEATSDCNVCSFENASDYLKTLYLEDYSYGWRDAGIVVLMVFSSYGLVYALMKLRTKTSKTAE
jgi:ABC-type multidrug transport system permease subunit/ABC-type multidrug transport system ATPase subunit